MIYKRKIRHILTLFIFLTSVSATGQISIKGNVTDNIGNRISGCYIHEIGTTNKTISDQNAQFMIQVLNNSAILEFSFIGYKTLKVKIDTINTLEFNAVLTFEEYDIDEIIAIAPSPPYIELGYLGQFNHKPIGAHLEYSKYGDKFRSNLDFATNNFKNNFYSYEIGPYRFGKSKLYDYLNLYVKGLINKSNYDFLFCNRFYFSRQSSLNIGVGTNKMSYQNSSIIFLTGIKYYIGLPFPFFTNYISFDFIYNRQTFDWIGSLYTELYNKKYKNLSVRFGYQSILNDHDFVLNINYKHYFLKK